MAFVRQSSDPDSMPNRRKRRMFNKEKKEDEEISLSTLYPDRRVLYNPSSLKGEIFLTVEEQEKALASGEWIEHPKMSLEDWIKFRLEEDEKPREEEEEHINWSERIKFRDSNKPPASSLPSAGRKYVSTMNVAELIKKGKEVGIDFGTPETCPTKQDMKRKIRFAESKE